MSGTVPGTEAVLSASYPWGWGVGEVRDASAFKIRKAFLSWL